MRTDRVWLDPAITRCEPQDPCPHTECGRRLALIPKGTPLEDFSQAASAMGFCMKWLPTNMRPEPKPRTVKDWPDA